MKVQCNHCGKKYTLPAERVAGRILKIRCRQCSNLFEVDGSQIVLTEPVPNQETSSPPNQSDSGVSAQLRTQEFSAIDLASQVSQPSNDVDAAKTLPTTQPTSGSAQSPHHQSNVNQLSVEVSQSAQEWMESVMSDVDRPITREIKLNEITGHRSLPPESRSSNLIWLSAIIVLLGLGYFITQISGPVREKPKVLTLTLSTDHSLVKEPVKEPAELSEPTQANSKLDPLTQPIEDKVSTEPKKAVQKSKATTSKRITPQKKKKETKAQFKSLNKALDDLKKSNLSASTTAKIEIEGNLDSDRKQASRSSSLSNKKSKKKSKPKASQTSKSAKKQKAQKSKKAKSKKSKSKQAKRSKSPKSSRKKAVSRKSGKGLDYSTISTIMNQNSGGLENCYRKALKKDSSFGEVRTRLKFRVSPEGRVARKTISLTGVYRRTRLESCIQNTVVRWYFPKAKGETPVRYPLTFTPGF